MVSFAARFSLRTLICGRNISSPVLQIFLSFFKTLVGKEIAVELKNDVVMTGTLHSVDQYLNIKLLNVKVINPEKYPQLVALQNCFVRGSVVRYIQIPPELVDTELLQDAARKENAPARK
jgi:small nuclear ribonucleoprotein (snRNP)-like protein